MFHILINITFSITLTSAYYRRGAFFTVSLIIRSAVSMDTEK